MTQFDETVTVKIRMKLHIYSDLHLEFWKFTPPSVTADVVVLAGDIGEGEAGLTWAREMFPDLPILYVIGNHELYGQRLPGAYDVLTEKARSLGIELLENRAIEFGDVRFLGATLWTDYALYAKNEEEAGRFMFAARRRVNDYKFIRQGERRKKGRDRILPWHLLEMHRASRAWLSQEIAKPYAGKTVVITHHAPHILSVPQRYDGDELTPCYASHLPDLVRTPVSLWIHGHIHDSMDYEVGGARVIANPRGYMPPYENAGFEEDMVVEV